MSGEDKASMTVDRSEEVYAFSDQSVRYWAVSTMLLVVKIGALSHNRSGFTKSMRTVK